MSISPPHGPIRHWPWRRILRWAVLLGVLWLLLHTLLITLVGWSTSPDHPADLGIVLGTWTLPSNKPSKRLAARLNVAAKLYHEGMIRKILVSGARDTDGQEEALAMRNYLRDQGVAPQDIYTDTHGVNTFATAAYARQLMLRTGMKSAIVITCYYHIPRAVLAHRNFGIEDVQGAASQHTQLRNLWSLLREFPAYYLYATRPYPLQHPLDHDPAIAPHQ